MATVQRLSIAVPTPFELPLVLRGHGWVSLPPHRYGGGASPWLVPLRLGAVTVSASVRQRGRRLQVTLQGERRLGARALATARAQLVHMLRIDDDLSAFWLACADHPRLHWVARRGGGRLLRSATVFEDLMKLLFTTNCSWAATTAMTQNLMAATGALAPGGDRAFPSAVECDRGERFFREVVRAGYRASAGAELAARFASGGLDDAQFLDPTQPTAALRQRLLALRGFGAYAAGQALRLFARYDDLALDSWCRATLAPTERCRDRAPLPGLRLLRWACAVVRSHRPMARRGPDRRRGDAVIQPGDPGPASYTGAERVRTPKARSATTGATIARPVAMHRLTPSDRPGNVASPCLSILPISKPVPMLRLPLLTVAAIGALTGAARAQLFFPPPPTPAGNPTTASKALLGKALFWDEQMSSSRTMACGTCHIFGHGGTDPRSAGATHPGPDGQFGTADDLHGSFGVVRQDVVGTNVGDPLFGVRPQSTGRRAPSVINAAYEVELFWDGRATSAFTDPVSGLVTLPFDAALESQAAGPPVSDVEMSHIGRSWSDIALDIANRTPLALADQIPANLQAFIAGQTYAQLFQTVYGTPGVTPERIIFAIAAYERTLVADQSPVDLFLAGLGTLSPQANAGVGLFFNFCSSCHADVLVQGAVTNDFRNVGVRPEAEDLGRFAITSNNADKGRFKVPSLRNVALRAPYMHTGGLPTLDAVMQLYNRGGDFGTNIDPLVSFIAGQLTTTDQQNLVAFMNALTDPRVLLQQAPFDRPRLWSESPRAPTVFGYGTNGTGGGAPVAVAAAPPFVGNTKFAIGVDYTLPGVPSLLVIDFAAQNPPTVMMGQNIYLALLAPDWYGMVTTQGATAGSGHASVSIPVPANNTLAGIPFFGQWMIGDPAGPFGFTTSNAFSAVIF